MQISNIVYVNSSQRNLPVPRLCLLSVCVPSDCVRTCLCVCMNICTCWWSWCWIQLWVCCGWLREVAHEPVWALACRLLCLCICADTVPLCFSCCAPVLCFHPPITPTRITPLSSAERHDFFTQLPTGGGERFWGERWRGDGECCMICGFMLQLQWQ